MRLNQFVSRIESDVNCYAINMKDRRGAEDMPAYFWMEEFLRWAEWGTEAQELYWPGKPKEETP